MSQLAVLAVVALLAVGLKVVIAWRKSGAALNRQEPCWCCAGNGCAECRES